MDTSIKIVQQDSNFEINGINFADAEIKELNHPNFENWPVLYILTHTDSNTFKTPLAYVGQTTGARRRMVQHLNSETKKEFTKVHIIYSKEFNQSVTFDYESKLISLMAADEKFKLINGNGGLSDKRYFNKTYYNDCFESLWLSLKKANLVTHDLAEIKNSDLFKYSPFKVLNGDQELAVQEIFSAIKANKQEPIVIRGMPGTGKTIIAIYMMKYLRDSEEFKDKEIALVVPQAALRKTLKRLFKQIYNLKATDVIGPSAVIKKQYDIVFVDEAHRLKQPKNIVNLKSHYDNNEAVGLGKTEGVELDWIIRRVPCPIFLYDMKQVIGPSGTNVELFDSRISKTSQNAITTITLKTQMRTSGGESYITYVEDLLNQNVKEKLQFKSGTHDGEYEFYLVDSFTTFNELMLEKEKQVGLSRMVAGYAWDWKSKKDPSTFDIEIDGIKKQWNTRTEDWVNSKNSLKEMGSIHTVQGYDLNYGFVVLGPDIKYNPETNEIYADTQCYFDKNGKKTATQEELNQYIKNIYYVLMTRGIKGTYLYVCDPMLKEYLKQFIDTYKEKTGL